MYGWLRGQWTLRCWRTPRDEVSLCFAIGVGVGVGWYADGGFAEAKEGKK